MDHLSSTNPTIVNGEEIRGKVLLKNSDVITIAGRSFLFKSGDEDEDKTLQLPHASLLKEDNSDKTLQLPASALPSRVSPVRIKAISAPWARSSWPRSRSDGRFHKLLPIIELFALLTDLARYDLL